MDPAFTSTSTLSLVVSPLNIKSARPLSRTIKLFKYIPAFREASDGCEMVKDVSGPLSDNMVTPEVMAFGGSVNVILQPHAWVAEALTMILWYFGTQIGFTVSFPIVQGGCAGQKGKLPH